MSINISDLISGNEELISLKQAAQFLNIEEQSLRNAIHRGELEAVDLGRGYQFRRSQLNGWINRKVVNPEASSEVGAGGE
jgi:excisionase family DNA binding protein